MTRLSLCRLRDILALALALAMASTVAARAELHLDLRNPQIAPMPIAIPDFAGSDPNVSQLGRDLTQVMSADLERSGLFQPLDQRAFIQTMVDPRIKRG